jgi:hypothetical protein
MCNQACIARIPAIGELAPMAGPHIERQESAHAQTDEIQVPDVIALGALAAGLVVLCTCVLSAVLTAAYTLVP